MQSPPQSRKLVARAHCQNLDAAVGIIANPARDTQNMRLALYEPAKAYALYASAHQESASFDGLIVRTHRFTNTPAKAKPDRASNTITIFLARANLGCFSGGKDFAIRSRMINPM